MKKLNSGYIISVVSAVLLLLEVIGVKVDVPYVNQVVMAVLGVLVAMGIVSGRGESKVKKNDTQDIVNDDVVENNSSNISHDESNELKDEVSDIIDNNTIVDIELKDMIEDANNIVSEQDLFD